MDVKANTRSQSATTVSNYPQTSTNKKTQKKSDAVADGLLGDASQVANREKVASSPGGYDVRVSTEAKSLADAHSKAFNIAKNTDPVREDRVRDLKKRIADGSYQVDSAQIADGMLREAVKDYLAERET